MGRLLWGGASAPLLLDGTLSEFYPSGRGKIIPMRLYMEVLVTTHSVQSVCFMTIQLYPLKAFSNDFIKCTIQLISYGLIVI